MGITIEDIIQGLKETYMICCSVCAYDRKKYIDGAIDTMHKYEKIKEIYKNWSYGADSCDCMKDIERVIEDGNDD